MLKEYAREGQTEGNNFSDRELVELLLQQSLSGTSTTHDKSRTSFLDRMEEDCDISDPFGGSLRDYKMCADEIEDALQLIVQKLKKN